MSRVANSPAAWDERAQAETSWEAALWSERSQEARFAAVFDHLPQGGLVLDFGCGTGAFAWYVANGFGDYTGYDWSPAMRARAREEHPWATILDEFPTPDVFDHVVAIGPFNLRDGWCKERTWETLQQLWLRAVKTLIVSLYRGNDPDCLSYSGADLYAFAHRVGCTRWIVDASYLPNDILLRMSR